MVTQKFLIACLLAVALAVTVTAVQVHSASSIDNSVRSTKSAISQSGSSVGEHSAKRTARIMKILKEPKSSPATHTKRIRVSQKPQPRRDHFSPPAPPPPGPQRAAPITYHRSPPQPPFGGVRNQVLRRVQNGPPPPPPPPNTLLRPQYNQQPAPQLLNYEQGKSARFPLSGKENISPINAGKGAVYRSQFGASSHPNALPPQGSPQQQFNNFKASPQYSGTAIVRPASQYPQYTKLLQDFAHYHTIKQYPLPQQHPQHQLQQQQQQQQQKQFTQYSNQHQSGNTAPQTFPALQQQPGKMYTETSLQSAESSETTQQMYSVYEEPDLTERAPVQFNSNLQQNLGTPPHAAPKTSSPMGAKEAEEYLKFMGTNEYFLPKFDPNYRQLDAERDMRQFKQQHRPPSQGQLQSQQQQYTQYSKTLPATDASGAATFQHPIEVSQLFYHPNASPASTIVRGSYQTGNNVFVVKSDGNKAVKHVVPSSVAIQGTTTPSIAGSYTQLHFNPLRHRTPEPIRFEFTEHDAVHATHTNAPPRNGHLRYKGVNSVSVPSQLDVFNIQASSSPSTTAITQNRPISVNEVDADPEDGDDMQEAGTGIYGRVPIRSSTEGTSGSAINHSASTTPATEQTDTEEYCERICANVQDDDEEIICGSDGYMYTGEAQMECYASCLHIDVTIQGKGTCSAR